MRQIQPNLVDSSNYWIWTLDYEHNFHIRICISSINFRQKHFTPPNQASKGLRVFSKSKSNGFLRSGSGSQKILKVTGEFADRDVMTLSDRIVFRMSAEFAHRLPLIPCSRVWAGIRWNLNNKWPCSMCAVIYSGFFFLNLWELPSYCPLIPCPRCLLKSN